MLKKYKILKISLKNVSKTFFPMELKAKVFEQLKGLKIQ